MASTDHSSPPSGFRVSFWGFVLGAAGPVALGIKAWLALDDYEASVKADGHEQVCGLPAIVPMMLFMFVAPFCGLIGALVAPTVVWLCGQFRADFRDAINEP